MTVSGSRGVADLDGGGLGLELLGESIKQWRLDDDLGVGHAHLPLMQEDAERGRIDRIIEVGIPKHNKRALAAHFKCELLQMPGCFDRKMTASSRRTGESNHLDARIGNQEIADLGRDAGYHVEHASR
jgi:hypothetical protein